jgi:hypothetical protein
MPNNNFEYQRMQQQQQQQQQQQTSTSCRQGLPVLLPELTGTVPVSIEMVVVLPAPLWPKRAVI